MASGINDKLKIVWICHFTNKFIQKKLNVKKKKPEFAPWISLGIEEVKKRNDIELHVISPHRWIFKKNEFSDKNIHYHFFNPGIPFIGRHWPAFFKWDYLSGFRTNKKLIKNFVDKIKPNIIHLHGFENAYYSSSIFQFLNKWPTLVTVQGFSSLDLEIDKLDKFGKNNIEIELKIMKDLTNFGVRNNAMKVEIRKHNPLANFFWHEYFINTPPKKTEMHFRNLNRVYDLIFFSRVSKAKGIEDLIEALGKLKLIFSRIKLAVIGPINNEYKLYLMKLAEIHNCLENIDFIGFLSTQEEVYNYLEKSKITVLPTYNDIIPGAIIESMLRRVPVVSYNTGGIPEVNEEEENILIVDQSDVNGLTATIQKLLEDESFQLEIAEKAYVYASKRWDNSKAMHDLMNIYNLLAVSKSNEIKK